MKSRTLPIVILIALVLAGCAKKKRVHTIPVPPVSSTEEVGIASWYGHPYHGRPSSSGEIYDMEKMTAAHRTLPFGTQVRVHNLDNNLSCEVRINDRGPFVEGRIIDLSHAAARQIQMIGPGTARVRLEILSTPQAPADCYYAVQTGAFRDRSNAERQRAAMQARYGAAQLTMKEGYPAVWRVLVGREPTIEQANALALKLKSELGAAFVVRVDPPSTHFVD